MFIDFYSEMFCTEEAAEVKSVRKQEAKRFVDTVKEEKFHFKYLSSPFGPVLPVVSMFSCVVMN